MKADIHLGDCIDVLASMPEASLDSIVTDPPYGLSFMGAGWDHDVPGPEYWRAVARVAKPGAMLLAFGGTRTFHRLTCAIEDAGWDVRDCLSWLYGQGFPKSLDISKAIDKAAGVEPTVVGSRVLTGRAAQSCAEKGGTYSAAAPSSAGLSKEIAVTEPTSEMAKLWSGWGTALKPAWEPIILARKPLGSTGLAAIAEARGFVGIELVEKHYHIARRRIDGARKAA